MAENRGRAKMAVELALGWCVEVGGVIALMLDYAELKPIRFRVHQPDDDYTGVWTDGTTAVRKKQSIESAHFLFGARCEYPLELCVSRWAIRIEEEIKSRTLDADHSAGIGTNTVDDTRREWYELHCDQTMFTTNSELRKQMWHPADRRFHADVVAKRSDQIIHDGVTVRTPAQLMVDGALPPSATVHVNVDLDTDTITWTLSDDQSIFMQVPNLRQTHAYVDLATNTRATIIQLPNPWIF